MLNTDQHNPQNRKRMTIDDYKRNLRGVNEGKDFDPEYLAAIHESIKKKEIILPEEHTGQPGFDYAWKGLMSRARTAGESGREFAVTVIDVGQGRGVQEFRVGGRGRERGREEPGQGSRAVGELERSGCEGADASFGEKVVTGAGKNDSA